MEEDEDEDEVVRVSAEGGARRHLGFTLDAARLRSSGGGRVDDLRRALVPARAVGHCIGRRRRAPEAA